jgi:hypothetical protein
MQAYPTIRTRDASTDPGQFVAKKRIGKLLLGMHALTRSTLLGRASWDAGALMELTGCLLHVVIIPSLFRNTDKREHVFLQYGYLYR